MVSSMLTSTGPGPAQVLRRGPADLLPCAVLWAVPEEQRSILESALQQAGLQAHPVTALEQLRDALFDEHVLVAVVYFGRDAGQGAAASRAIRRHPQGGRLPILAIISPRLAAGFPREHDADEVLIEPYGPEEAALRVRMALWRTDHGLGEEVVKIGELTVDPAAMHVRLRGVPVDLTYKEFALLRHFLSNPGLAMTRQQILSAVWGEDYFGGDRTVDIHVRRLRAKLPPLAERIQTVYGVGYRFSPGAPGSGGD